LEDFINVKSAKSSRRVQGSINLSKTGVYLGNEGKKNPDILSNKETLVTRIEKEGLPRYLGLSSWKRRGPTYEPTEEGDVGQSEGEGRSGPPRYSP